MIGKQDAIVKILRPNGVLDENITMDYVREAAKHGRLAMLQVDLLKPTTEQKWWKERTCLAGEDDEMVHVLRQAMHSACEFGQLHVIEWLVEEKAFECDTNVAHAAAMAGHIHVLQCIKQQGLRSVGYPGTNPMDWHGVHFVDSVAGAEQLEIVKWLIQHREEGRSASAIDNAAAGGHLEVVVWLHEKQPKDCTVRAMDGAAKNGHLKVVKWLHGHCTKGVRRLPWMGP